MILLCRRILAGCLFMMLKIKKHKKWYRFNVVKVGDEFIKKKTLNKKK